MVKPTLSVTLDEHWANWVRKIVEKRIRLSAAAVVREGLVAIKFNLDHELDEAEEIDAERKERKEDD